MTVISEISEIHSGSQRNKSLYDLNSIFVLINLAIFLCGACIYMLFGGNKYIDGLTMLLLLSLCMQNILLLTYEKRNRDPFIVLLVIINSFFYTGRVLTLLYDPWSVPLDAGSYSPADINHAIIFILLSNSAICAGLCMARGKINDRRENDDEYPGAPCNVIIILSFTLIAVFFVAYIENIIGRLAGYIGTFVFNVFVILLCSLIYLILNYRRITKPALLFIVTLLVVFVILSTLSGSRAGLFVVAYLTVIGLLSVRSGVILSRRFILMVIALSFCSVVLFTLGTYIRGVVNLERGPISSKELSIFKESSIFEFLALRVATPFELYRPIFDRIGFLDYATVVIRNHEKYSNIINFTYYGKSIIDNVLTPGFTVFDTPRVSHAMSYIARDEPVPSLEDILSAYQSDMPTLYGDYYVLFHGYGALAVLFVFSYLFKTIYLSIRTDDTFYFYLYHGLILYVFYLWINSFGIDWFLLDIAGIVTTTVLFRGFYRMRRKKSHLPSEC